jgi:hypothetical protein
MKDFCIASGTFAALSTIKRPIEKLINKNRNLPLKPENNGLKIMKELA